MSRGEPGEARVPDDLVLAPATALAEAQRLVDAGRPFHAHEVLEACWKASGPGDRALWRGLAQLAVGLTHAHRGNARGAVALLRRGAEGIRPYTGVPDTGVDVAAAVQASEDLARRIERLGLPALSPSDLRIPLRRHTEP